MVASGERAERTRRQSPSTPAATRSDGHRCLDHGCATSASWSVVQRVDAELADRLARSGLARSEPMPAHSSAGNAMSRPPLRHAAAARDSARSRLSDGSDVMRVTPQLQPSPFLHGARRYRNTQFLARCGEAAERCSAPIDAAALRPIRIPAGRLVMDAVLAAALAGSAGNRWTSSCAWLSMMSLSARYAFRFTGARCARHGWWRAERSAQRAATEGRAKRPHRRR